MTEEAGALVVRLEATVAQFERQMQRANRAMNRSAGRIRREADTLDRRLERVGARFGVAIPTAAAASAAAIAGVGLALRSTVRNGDALRALEGRFEALTGSAERSAALVEQVFATATGTGAAVDTVGALTSQFLLAAESIDATDAEVARFTQALVQLGAIGGSTGQEIANGSRQLGQALAGGIVRAEEFNSVLENTPLVARAIADALNLSIGALRQMVLEGELTADRVFNAILSKAEETQAAFEGLPPTLERATGRLAAAWARFTAEIDKSLGLTERLATAVDTLAGALNLFSGSVDLSGSGPLAGALGIPSVTPPGQMPSSVATPVPTPTPGAAPSSTGSVRSGGRSQAVADAEAMERAVAAEVDALARRIELLNAEYVVMGESAAVRADAAAQMEILAAKRAVETAAAERGLEVDQGAIRTIEQLGELYRDLTGLIEERRAATEATAEAEREAAAAALRQRQAIETIGNAMTVAIQRADSFSDALRNVALSLLNVGVQGLFGAGPLGGALGSVGPSIGGSIFGSSSQQSAVVPTGQLQFAPKVVPFARGGVVASPTLFGMAGGATGLMGEAGPEAILPLRRGPGGRLGVEAATGGGGVTVTQSFTFGTNVDRVEQRAFGERIKRETVAAIVAARREDAGFLA